MIPDFAGLNVVFLYGLHCLEINDQLLNVVGGCKASNRVNKHSNTLGCPPSQ